MLTPIASSGGAANEYYSVFSLSASSETHLTHSGVDGVDGSGLDSAEAYLYFARQASAGNAVDVYRIATAGITSNTASNVFDLPSSSVIHFPGQVVETLGSLWMSSGEGSGASAESRVYSWNGASVTEEDAVTTPTSALGFSGGILLLDHNGVLFHAHQWQQNSVPGSGVILPVARTRSGGSWSTVDLPAVWVESRRQFQPTDAIVFNSKTWLCGYNYRPSGSPTLGVLLSWTSGSTAVTERSISATSRVYIYAMAVVGSYLYYLWADIDDATGNPISVSLGRTDGSSFNDSYVDIGALSLTEASGMVASSDGFLHILLIDGKLYRAQDSAQTQFSLVTTLSGLGNPLVSGLTARKIYFID